MREMLEMEYEDEEEEKLSTPIVYTRKTHPREKFFANRHLHNHASKVARLLGEGMYDVKEIITRCFLPRASKLEHKEELQYKQAQYVRGDVSSNTRREGETDTNRYYKEIYDR
jgi:hypothetical protein